MPPGGFRTGSEPGTVGDGRQTDGKAKSSLRERGGKHALCVMEKGERACHGCPRECRLRRPLFPDRSGLVGPTFGRGRVEATVSARAPNFHARLVTISGGGLMGLPRGGPIPTEDFMLRAELTLGIRTFAPRSVRRSLPPADGTAVPTNGGGRVSDRRPSREGRYTRALRCVGGEGADLTGAFDGAGWRGAHRRGVGPGPTEASGDRRPS